MLLAEASNAGNNSTTVRTVISNFILNRNVTWFERRAVGAGALVSEAGKYHLASAISVAANGVAFFLLTEAGANVLLAGAVSVWIGVATSFLGAERFVFTTRRGRPLRRTLLPVQEPGANADDSEEPALLTGTPAAIPTGRVDD